MDLRIDPKDHPSGGVVQKSTFARFLASFDFRLFRQYRPMSDVRAERRVLLPVGSGNARLSVCFQCLSVKLTVLARAPGAIFLSQKGHLVILITAPDGHPSVTESVVLPP